MLLLNIFYCFALGLVFDVRVLYVHILLSRLSVWMYLPVYINDCW